MPVIIAPGRQRQEDGNQLAVSLGYRTKKGVHLSSLTLFLWAATPGTGLAQWCPDAISYLRNENVELSFPF